MVRLFSLALLLIAAPTAAQPADLATNRALLERLAVACLPPGVTGSVVLSADGMPSFLLDAVRRDLLASGATIWAADSPNAATASRLELSGWTGRVDLAGRGRTLDRTATTSADVRWTRADGSLAHVEACRGAFSDRVDRRMLGDLENPLIAETVATRPPPSRLRRWSEPLIAGGAVVVGILLLFSVRS